MLFFKIIAPVIVLFIVCFIYYKVQESNNLKKQNSWQQFETGTSNGFINWLYSGKHPQQKYYKNLYTLTEENRKKLEHARCQKKHK